MKTFYSLTAVLIVLLSTRSLAQSPTIVAPPVTNAVIPAGGTLTLQVTTSGSSPFTYQWRKGTTPIDGATSPAYSKQVFASADVGNYHVTVTNSAGTVTSPAAVVTLAPAIGTLAADPAFAPPDFKNDALAGRATIDALGRVYATYTNGGYISGVGNQQRGAVIRFNADGSADNTFNIGAALVEAWPILIQSDGRILVGGVASHETSETGFALPRVFRFNADGTRDFTYQSPHFAADPRFMTIQPDGKLLVVASSNLTANGGIPVMARLNADGSLDSTFTQPTLSSGGSIFLPPTVEASGNIYVGGIFSTINGVARPAIARLLANGALDTAWVPTGFTVGGTAQIRGLALQTQGANAGKLLVAGGPLTVAGSASPSANRPVVRLLSTGALDTTFTLVTQTDAGMNPRPRLIKTLGDDRFYVVGSTVTRFLADGAIDTTYPKPAFSTEFFWMDAMADGRVVVCPELGATINGNAAPTLVRLTATGTIDASFAPGRINREVYPGRFAVLPDSKLLTWGPFERANATTVPGIARFNANGSLDSSFAVTGVPDLSYVAFAEVGADGRILAGTRTGTNLSALTSGIVRLQPDGALDSSFTLDAALAGSTNSMEFRLLPENKVSVWSLSAQGLVSDSNFLRRLSATGAGDTAFNSTGLGSFGSVYRGANGAITSITLGAFRILAHDAAGRLIARATTGDYPASPSSLNYTLLRINANGSLDTTFNAPTLSWPTAVSFPTVTDAQTNGGAAGQISSTVVYGYPFSGVTPVSGGKLLIYGIFTELGGQPAPGIARLTATGALDTTFNVGTGARLRYQPDRRAQIEGVTVAPDGKMWITGAFDTFNGVAAPGIVRLDTDGTVDLGFATDIFYRPYLGGITQVAFAPNGTTYVSGTYSRGGDTFPSPFQALVNSATPIISTQPVAAQSIALGATATFTVAASGTDLTFQWRQDGENIAGATNATYSINPVSTASSGLFDVVIANGAGSVASRGSGLSVSTIVYPGVLSPDPAWDPNPVTISNRTFAAVRLPDGKFLVGGESVRWDGQPRTAVARLNADLTLDTTWTPPLINGIVYAFAASPDGSVVYVGGEFTAVDGHRRSGLARLVGPSLTHDLTWRSLEALPATSAPVSALALQDNLQLLVARVSFITGVVTGTNVLVRLNPDGTLDSTFSVDISTAVAGQRIHSLVAEPGLDGKIAFAGSFTAVNGTARGGVARVNSTGATLDTVFGGTGANNTVNFLSRLSNGRYVLGGNFTQVNSLARIRVAVLTAATGAVDATFVTTTTGTTSGNAHSAVELTDGRLLVFGSFTQYAGNAAAGFVRLHGSTGAFDSAFTVGIGAQANAFNISSAGRNMHAFRLNDQDVVGLIGTFNQLLGQRRVAAARLNAGITAADAADVSKTLVATPTALVHRPAFTNAAFLEKNGALTVFGSADSAGGTSSLGQILRVNPNGSIDSSFPGGTGFGLNGLSTFGIYRAARQSDGKFIATGDFLTYNAVNANRLVRINADGTHDASFNAGAGPSNFLVTPATLASGKVVLFGSFGSGFTYNNTTVAGNILRLNADGTRDAAFVNGTGFNSAPAAVLEFPFLHGTTTQESGKLLVGGGFTTYNGTTVPGLVLLRPDGSSDSAFAPVGPAGGSISGFVLLPDGRIVVHGSFTSFNGTSANRLAIIRSSDGSLDTSFTAPAAIDAPVNQVVLQADGKLIVSGEFTVGPALRLGATGTLDTTFGLRGITGFPGGSSGARFILADDGILYFYSALVSLDYGAPRALARFKGAPAAPSIERAPLGGNLVVGSPFVLSVRVAGTAPYTYQWKRNDTAIDGATDSVYVIPAASATNAGNYTVVVTGPGGSVTSTPANLAEVTTVALRDQPVARRVAAGATVQFAVSATTTLSSATLTYQWRKAGTAISSATNSALTLPRVATADAGAYTVLVSDGTNTVTSQPADLVITAADPVLWQQFTEFSTEQAPARTVHDGAGKVYVPWSVYDRSPDMAGGKFVGALARFDEATGALDPSFSLDRRIRGANHVVVMPDGKLLIATRQGDANSVARVTATGELDSTFTSPLFARAIRFITRQSDGKVIVVAADNLDTNAPASALGADALAVYRLNADGTLDGGFTRATVNSTLFGPPVVDSTGRVYLAGSFTQVNTSARLGVGRLLADGTLDAAFPSGLPAGFTFSQIRAVVLQSGDRPVFVGDFHSTPRGTSSNRVMAFRFTSAGAFDSTFAQPLRSELGLAAGLRLRHVLVLADDSLLAVSDRLVRLTPNGTPDTTFNAREFGKEAFWLSVGTNGRLFVPDQTSIAGVATPQSTVSNGILTTLADGTPDFSFQTGGWGRIAYPTDGAVLSDGRFWVAGNFNRVGGTYAPGMVLFNADGTASTTQAVTDRSMVASTAAPTLNNRAYVILSQPTNSNQPSQAAELVRATTDLVADATFVPVLPAGYDLTTAGLFTAPDGKVLLAQGSISAQAALNGATGDSLLRLHANGSRDSGYTPALSSFAVVERNGTNQITAIKTGGLNVAQVLPDGRALVVVSAVDGNLRLLRLNADGTADTGFTPPSFGTLTGSSGFTSVLTDPVSGTSAQFPITTYSASDLIRTAVPMPDGKVYVGGRFQLTYANAPRGLARLNANGTLDTTFTGAGLGAATADAGPYASKLVVDSVGRLYVAGRFDNYNGSTVPGIFRLRADGVFDSGWNPGFAVLDAPRAAVNLVIAGDKLHAFGTVGLPGDPLPAIHRVADISPTVIAQQNFETLLTGPGKLVTNPFSGFAGYSFINVAPNFSLGPITGDPIQGILATSPLGTGQAGYLGGAGTNLVPPATNTLFTSTVFGGRYDDVPVNLIGSATPFRRISADFILDRHSGTNSQGLAFNLYDTRDLADAATTSFHSQVYISPTNVVSISDHDFAYAATPTTLANGVPYRVTITVNYNTATWSAQIAKIDGTATYTLATDRPINTKGFVLSGWTRPGTFEIEMSMVASATNKALLDRFIFDNLVVSALPDPNGALLAVTPATASGGTVVTINGYGFTGTTTVKFNGTDAAFTIVSDTEITTTVPALATTGVVTVVKPGATFTAPGTFTVTGGGNFINLSRLGNVGPDNNPVLLNFTIEGSAAKPVVIRAAGPSLASLGLLGTLADPVLVLFDASGTEIGRNDDWGGGATLQNAFSAVGAFPFSAANSKDSALLVTLAPGTYTARISGAGVGTGTAIVEIYDAGGSGRLSHLATRTAVNSGTTSGFIIGGTGVRTVLLRAIGSPLVTALGAASNPSIKVFTGPNVQIAQNDDFVASADLSAATAAAGALPLATNDAALLLTLAPGAYTVQTTAATAGFVLTEIHAIDSFRAASFKPALLAPLQNTAVAAGAALTLNAPVLAKPAAVTYVWKKDGTAVTSGVPVSGSPGALHFPSVLSTGTGIYTVEMTNTAGTTVSAPASVAVSPPAGYAATHSVLGTGGYLAGGTVTITNTLTYVAPSQSLGWSVILPAGWSYVSSSGEAGETRPTAADTRNISWAWTTVPPAGSVTFTYTLSVPAGDTATRELTAFAVARPGGNPVVFAANPHPLNVSAVVAHSADTNQDFRIGLIELTRVIELFNTRIGTVRTGRYAVATTATEDGFASDPVTAPSATVPLPRYHSADTARTATRDGKIDLIELTRVIELYNTRVGTVRTGAYRAATDTEDGYESVP